MLGRYIYIEASYPRAGDTAILWSPLFNSSAAANCSVRFFAFMYGQDMGSLVVSQVIGTSWTQLINISGEQGQDWKKFSLNVPLSGGKKFKVIIYIQLDSVCMRAMMCVFARARACVRDCACVHVLLTICTYTTQLV